jgi:hypothetical protein
LEHDPVMLQLSVPLQKRPSSQAVLAGEIPQLPLPPQKPVRQVCVGHSFSGSIVARVGPQVPVATPVSLMAHDIQVPVQAELQQIPPMLV